MIEIVDPGRFTSVQDLGRGGHAALGVARSGAFDRAALRAANRLVGNDDGAAALEITLGGLVLLAVDAATVALTGARCPGLDTGVAVSLPAGAAVRLGVPPSGLRSYLALRGGIDAPVVLGSRSTDTLSGLGPAPLRAGDQLGVGAQPLGEVSGTAAVIGDRAAQPQVIRGPRDDWFAPDALAALVETAWTVRPESDRIGVRLDGPSLARARSGELPSEPTLPGALQVPPDGHPILLGPDAPVTGGYPVIAVLRDADLDAVAQWRPGQTVRFAGTPVRSP